MFFHRQAAYTSVFVGPPTKQPSGGAWGVHDFTLASHHDSCWRTDGFDSVRKLYFELCEEADPSKAPAHFRHRAQITEVSLADRVEIGRGGESYGPGRLQLMGFRVLK